MQKAAGKHTIRTQEWHTACNRLGRDIGYGGKQLKVAAKAQALVETGKWCEGLVLTNAVRKTCGITTGESQGPAGGGNHSGGG
jgi:hypothetical protein